MCINFVWFLGVSKIGHGYEVKIKKNKNNSACDICVEEKETRRDLIVVVVVSGRFGSGSENCKIYFVSMCGICRLNKSATQIHNQKRATFAIPG